MIEVKSKIAQKVPASIALEHLQSLVHKPIVIEVGYGGVLFCEIGVLRQVNFHRPTVMYQGEARIYANEYWELRKNGKKIVDWWHERGEVEQLTSGSTISAIEFRKKNTETYIKLSKGYDLVIVKRESLETWDVQFDKKKMRLEAHGVGNYFLFPHEPKEPIKHAKRLKEKKEDPFIKTMYKEDLPLSCELVRKIVTQLNGIKVSAVNEYSGVSFALDFRPSNRWRFSVNCNWQLLDSKGELVLNSVSQRFIYGDQLRRYLVGTNVVSFVFDDALLKTELLFNSGHRLILPAEKRSHLWTFFDQNNHYHIWAEPKGKFFHTILCPDRLMKKYQAEKHGRLFAHVMHALEMYRKWIAL